MTNHRVGGTQIETGVDGGAETQLRSGSNEMAGSSWNWRSKVGSGAN